MPFSDSDSDSGSGYVFSFTSFHKLAQNVRGVCVWAYLSVCVCVTVTIQKLLLTFLLRRWLNALPAGNKQSRPRERGREERQRKRDEREREREGGRQASFTMVLAMRRVLAKFFFRNLLWCCASVFFQTVDFLCGY